VCGKSEGKKCKAKYRPASILLNVNVVPYFKFKLQLKLINNNNNNNSSFIIVNFHTG
jgi:hypothetical protein